VDSNVNVDPRGADHNKVAVVASVGVLSRIVRVASKENQRRLKMVKPRLIKHNRKLVASKKLISRVFNRTNHNALASKTVLAEADVVTQDKIKALEEMIVKIVQLKMKRMVML
jgi:hypothetical protein